MLAVIVAVALGPGGYYDVIRPVQLKNVKLGGYIGNRIRLNEANRLKKVDLKPLLIGFKQQPGSHPWIGEHIGKWIHAATLAWQNSQDPELKKKLDAAVEELISYQQPDGYLGTYTPDKRFGLYEGADWDVWTHKYDLIGLLAYHNATGDPKALECCTRIADLLMATFGPGKRSIRSAGTHVGMAATSVLEPIALLYNAKRDKRYLDFAQYLVTSWEEPSGPKIFSTLLANKPIDKVGNGKAYEMLSNLVGLCELARATGNSKYLQAAKNGWADVVRHERYLTGSASYYEHFHAGSDLPNQMGRNVGETCVTVTWMQLSQQLFRLTGEAKYAEEFERSAYNHLAAAQNPDGEAWCYYTALEGTKPYTQETCCCLSSGPRGMAIVPEMAYGVEDNRAVVVNTLEMSSAKLMFDYVSDPTLTMVSEFPKQGLASLTVAPNYHRQYVFGSPNRKSSVPFAIKIRVPSWATNFRASIKGTQKDGWYTIAARTWPKSTKIDLKFDLKPKLVLGTEGNKGLAAWTFGPFVMAHDERDGKAPPRPILLDNPPFLMGPLRLATGVVSGGRKHPFFLRAFADAGASGQRFRIWYPAPGTQPSSSLFDGSPETRSQWGNVQGSITDGDPQTFVVTWNKAPQAEAYFAASVAAPISFRRIVFMHGRAFHDGGWFDSSKGKPVVEIREKPGMEWRKVGELTTYPATTATDAKGLKDGQPFSLTLPKAVKAIAIRVRGVPASGDSPEQAFASCGELHAYEKLIDNNPTKER